MPKFVPNSLRLLLPAEQYRSIEMYVSRKRAVRWLKSIGVLALADQVASRFNYTVQAGPFAGMRYTSAAVRTRHVTPALLGVYERQLYPYIQAALDRCDLVVDVGSADGYFAVGAALRGKQVVAFDADPHERKILAEMSALNGVAPLITIRPWCDPPKLLDLIRRPRVFVIS